MLSRARKILDGGGSPLIYFLKQPPYESDRKVRNGSFGRLRDMERLSLETRKWQMQAIDESMSCSKGQVTRVGEFFRKLSPSALLDVEALEFPTSYQPGSHSVWGAGPISSDLHHPFRRSEALYQFE